MNSHRPNQMAASAIVAIDLQGKLEKMASGKVRDLFEVDDERLLFVASDRISAFDVVLKNVSLKPTFLPVYALTKWNQRRTD